MAQPDVALPASYLEWLREVVRVLGGPAATAEALTRAGLQTRVGRGYDPEAIRAWLRGETQPNARVIWALAEASEVSIDRYIRGEALQATLEDLIAQSERRTEARLQETVQPLRDRLAWVVNITRTLVARTAPSLTNLLRRSYAEVAAEEKAAGDEAG